MRIDIHSHILPAMDDGSDDCQMSEKMLLSTAAQGIQHIVATPHFYAIEEDLRHFLQRRAESFDNLQNTIALPNDLHITLGAEVYFFEGISYTKDLRRLTIQGTEILLLEMPFSKWTDRMISEILMIHKRQDLIVLMAHIERYMRWQKKEVWEKLLREGVLMQCNADFFLSPRTRRKAMRMLNSGEIHFLGSDCHNLKGRRPRLGEAMAILDDTQRDILDFYAQRYLSGLTEAVIE